MKRYDIRFRSKPLPPETVDKYRNFDGLLKGANLNPPTASNGSWSVFAGLGGLAVLIVGIWALLPATTPLNPEPAPVLLAQQEQELRAAEQPPMLTAQTPEQPATEAQAPEITEEQPAEWVEPRKEAPQQVSTPAPVQSTSGSQPLPTENSQVAPNTQATVNAQQATQQRPVYRRKRRALPPKLGQIRPSEQSRRKQEAQEVSAQAAQQANTNSNFVEAEPVIGYQALYQYIHQEMRKVNEFPGDSISGIITINFIVDKDGKVQDAEVLQPMFPALDNAALETINALPDWKPAYLNGQPITRRMSLPIRFSLKRKPAAQPMPDSIQNTTTNANQSNTGTEASEAGGQLDQ